jgi:hypothetical protein
MPAAERAAITKQGGVSTVIQGQSILHLKGRVYIPDTAVELRSKIFSNVHADATLHAGAPKARERLRNCGIHVANFDKHYKAYYDSCICQVARAPATVQATMDLVPAPLFPALAMVTMDVMYLPVTEDGYVGAIITMDTASRRVHLLAVKDSTAAGAVEALRQWHRTVGRLPVAVDTDGGPTFRGAFKDYLVAQHIEHNIGTAHNHVGRGLVERTVRTVKYAVRCMLQRGKLALWRDALGDIEIFINNTPRDSLGGISPVQYLTNVADVADPLATLPVPHLPPARLADALAGRRWLADAASALASILNAVTAPRGGVIYAKGDWVLLQLEHKPDDGLAGDYTGPFIVTDVEMANGPEGRVHTGWYSVARLLANNKHSAPKRVRAARLWGFDASRTDADTQHQESLPPGFFVVKAVLDHGKIGTPEQGMVQVQYLHSDKPFWQPVEDLEGNAIFRAYCVKNNLSLDGLPKQGGASAKPETVTRVETPAAAPLPAAPAGAGAVATAALPATGGATVAVAGTTSNRLAPGTAVYSKETEKQQCDRPAVITAQLPHDHYEIQWQDGSSTKKGKGGSPRAIVPAGWIVVPLAARAARRG